MAKPNSAETTVMYDRRRWTNWFGNLNFRPERHYRAASLLQLVEIVRDARAAGGHLRAYGSRGAFAPIAVCDQGMVDTRHLDRDLRGVVPEALKDQGRAMSRGGHLVHVQAGVTLRALSERLDVPRENRCRLTLPTMGGAAFQSIAGAISTGTHGGDIELKPLPDYVRAIHLVGADGCQHWIEPAVGAITDEDRLRAALRSGEPWFDDDMLEVHYDDALFDAALVSLGRLGIVYSLVVEAVEQFGLDERLEHTVWSSARDLLTVDGVTAQHRGPEAAHFLEVVLYPYARRDGQLSSFVTRRTKVDAPQYKRWRYPTVLSRLAAVRVPFLPTLGQVVGWLLNGALNLGLAGLVRWTGRHALRAGRPRRRKRQVGYQVMDLSSAIGETYRGVGMEVFLNMKGGGHLAFIDDVLLPLFAEYAERGDVFPGYVSLRTMRASHALLAMQRWPHTCSIEIGVFEGIRHTKEFLAEVQFAAISAGATVHWGQHHDTSAKEVERMYPDLPAWQEAVAVLGATSGDVFDNEYCSSHGLEPR
ncbi:FAD-binding protein [Cellulomonas dongxiuzhuiae]|uniref:FAD-binding protein n=1 Tax=Cellulomonas dongxiuzhuiae TaxID=2819979 RepID=UPI001AAFA804|nr:FAD-binding protein [Cellulomonas dongxiuzhuiae]MBO3087123.1 FAD-binding protein [Cellulomonas dongxiuzhuiae]